MSSKTAAVIAEPEPGEGGIRPLTPAFAAAITEVCSKTGALFIADEVQSGVGRTGYPFYFKALGLHPHLVSVGKALGSGVQSAPRWSARKSPTPSRSAITGRPTAATCWLAGRRWSFSMSWSAAVYSPKSAASGNSSRDTRAIAARHPIVKEVRGAGLMWGLELTRDAGAVVPADSNGGRGQPDRRNGRSAAATARHQRSGSGRGTRPPGCGPGAGELRNETTDPGRITLRTAGASDAKTVCADSANLKRGISCRARSASPSTPSASSLRSRREKSSAAPSWRPQSPRRRSAIARRGQRAAPRGRGDRRRARLRARREGYEKLCAFTHAPRYFIHMGFSIVPHLWLTEKVFTDCVKCPQFRSCGQCTRWSCR